ncbi:MAG: hypothetical protein J7J02_04200 [Sulfurovum sp.]|nr:hypothetical protein [Sulfurovum sp.]
MKDSILKSLSVLTLLSATTLSYAATTVKGPMVRNELPNPGLDARVNIVPMVKKHTGTVYTVETLPLNAALYYDSVKIEEEGFTLTDPNKVTIDPEDGDITAVFTYTSRDALGNVTEPRSIIMRFLNIELSGSVFHDFDGNTKVDGEKISTLDGETLFITLVNAESEILASKKVSQDGTYDLDNKDGVQPYKNYAIVISGKKNTLNTVFSDTVAPSGENINSMSKGKDRVKDGIVVVRVKDKDISQIDFGLDIRPLAEDKTARQQLNPGGKEQITVPTLTGSDEEDGGKVRYYILTLPQNAILFHKRQKISKAGTEIKDPSRLTLDPDDGDMNVSFEYVTADYAGVTSSPAKVDMTFIGLTISGSVFEDGDGDTHINGNPISTVDGKVLHVMLMNDRNIILASKAVDENGTYSFNGKDGIVPGLTYRLVLSTRSRASTSMLAKGWVNAGEGVINHDDKKDGQTTVKIENKDLDNVNFSVNKIPEAQSIKAASQLNPGTDTDVPVPPLQGRDLENADHLVYTVTDLPKDASLLYVGTKIVKVPFVVTDPNKLTIDPENGARTVIFSYKATDPDGISSEVVPVVMPFSELQLSGHLFNDGNSDNNVSGPLIDSVDGKALYVLLLDSNKTLLASKAIEKGLFRFDGKDGVKPESQFFIALAKAPKVDAFGLPKTWNHTGEAINSAETGKDSAADGVIGVKILQNDVSDIDFGINKQPHADHKETKTQLNPGLDIRVAVPALSGDDRESGKDLMYKIESLPTLGTLYYNDTKVDTIGFVVEDEANLSIDPQNADLIVLFTYATTDEAGVISDPTRVTMPFKGLHISGRVVNDGNGNDEIKGKGIKIPKNLHPYATLLDEDHAILASKPLTRDAKFTFSGKDGIRPNANFSVVISLKKNSLVPLLPEGWEESGAASGEQNASKESASSDGSLTIYVGEKSMDTLEFGINKKPSADNKNVKSMINPGGTVEVGVPELTGNDRESGTDLKYIVKKVPENVILYNRGIVVKNNDYVDPKYLMLDPQDGKQTVIFTYASVDAEGILSEPATVTMDFSGLNISGSILEDFMIDGEVDSVITVAEDTVKFFVTLLSDKGEVLASVPVSNKGTYLFDQAMGVNAHTKYRVLLSVDANVTTSTLPKGWNYADGENVNSLGKGNDGKADGLIDINVKDTDLKKVDFSVNYLIQ